jgi:5'-nucleotidase
MRIRRLLALSVGAALLVSVTVATAGPAAAAKQPPVKVVVTNDDGAAAPGIDALVRGLRKIPGVKVTVVAPATNQTGASDKTTPGTLQATEMTTGGAPSTGVVGYPADTVNYALDTLHLEPDVVISGINEGQNVGPGIDLSGTVGAARTAARRGIPALAINQGIALIDGELTVPDYAPSVRAAVKWLKEHRKALTPKKSTPVEAFVDNVNVPTCAAGTKPRGTVEVPIAAAGEYLAEQDCASTATDPAEDITALNTGFIAFSPSVPF